MDDRESCGGETGSRTRHGDLARITCSPLLSPGGSVDGAWSWFRANLSAFSARRCHQISFPGIRELARTRRIELLSPEWRSGIEPINYIRKAIGVWCVPEDSNLSSANLPVSQTPVLQTGSRTRTRRNWRRAEGSNPCPCGPLGFRDRLPATPAEPSVVKMKDGQGGWIRTNGLLRPRQALLALLSYTLLVPRNGDRRGVSSTTHRPRCIVWIPAAP